MTLLAPAKLNLTLAVLGMRPDGYHDLRSVVVPISLADTVTLEPAEDVVDASGLELGGRNLTVKAARVLQRALGVTRGVRIGLVKRIPAGAGLGGGSADAAAVLLGLNDLWHLGCSRKKLVSLAAEVGSDVPALVQGGPVLMEGRGERVRPLVLADERPFIVYTPHVFAATPDVFREFRNEDRGLGPNDLQPAACRLYPQIDAARARLREAGALEVRMSGSGSTVFGRAPNDEEAQAVAARLRASPGFDGQVFVCTPYRPEPTHGGVRI